MVDDPERINQIKKARGHRLAQVFDIGLNESDVVEAVNLSPFLRYLEAPFGQVHGCNFSASSSEIYRVGTDAASYLEDSLAGPAGKFGEMGDVRFNEILSCLHFIEVPSLADWLWRMTDVARSRIPEISNLDNGNVVEVIHLAATKEKPV